MNKQMLTMTPKSPMMKAAKLVELGNAKKILMTQLEAITMEMQPLKDDLLKITQDLDVLSLKTGSYTISRAIRITPQVEDFKTLKASLEKAGVPILTEEAFSPQMDVVFKEALKEGREFEGLGKKETQYIAVRVATKKEDESGK
jgi:hypothetical protein